MFRAGVGRDGQNLDILVFGREGQIGILTNSKSSLRERRESSMSLRMEFHQLGDGKAVGGRFVGKIKFHWVHGKREVLSRQLGPQVWG